MRPDGVDSQTPQVYGAAIQFYESFPRELLSERQSVRLGLLSVVDRRPITNRSLQVKKSICVLSQWPFFNVFQKFLTFIYRYSVSGAQVLPLEKSVLHIPALPSRVVGSRTCDLKEAQRKHLSPSEPSFSSCF